MFTHVRKTSLLAFTVVLFWSLLKPLFAFYVFYGKAWQESIYTLTYGLIAEDFLFNVLEGCLILIFIIIVGRLRLRDLGLGASLPQALLFTALLWMLTQLSLALYQLVTAGQISWNGLWRNPTEAVMVERIVSQLFGNALYEEIVWRGFIFVQLFLLLESREVKRALLTSLLVSQALFALMHIPFQLITQGESLTALPFWILATGVAGVIFTAFYIKTQNLFIAVGFHALFNAPTQLFAPPTEDSQIPTTIVTLLGLALVFWPVTGRLWQGGPRTPPNPSRPNGSFRPIGTAKGPVTLPLRREFYGFNTAELLFSRLQETTANSNIVQAAAPNKTGRPGLNNV